MNKKTEDEYRGEWITTYLGKKFHFKKPALKEIDIVDIAHHLSLLCRFTGAVREFYSVGEHSVRVSRIVPDEFRLSALLHDAAEAYINDISRPVKYSHKLDETEAVITKAIDLKFHTNSYAPEVKEADDLLFATEARDLTHNRDNWAELPPPLATRIVPVPPRIAEKAFLYYYKVYRRLE